MSVGPGSRLGFYQVVAWLAAAAAGLAIGIAATYAAVAFVRPSRPVAEAIAFSLAMPERTTLVGGGPTGSPPAPLALSPDGRQLAFLATGPDGVRRIWVRARSAVAPRRFQERTAPGRRSGRRTAVTPRSTCRSRQEN